MSPVMFAEKWKWFLHTKDVDGMVCKQDDEPLRIVFCKEFKDMLTSYKESLCEQTKL